MKTLTRTLAERVAQRMRRDGYEHCTVENVQAVWDHGYLNGDDDDGGLASRILQEFAELGLQP